MSKLLWDQSGERRYETGCDHGVLYTEKVTTAGDPRAFKTASPWNGLTSVTDSPSGADANDIYADNMLYASLRAAEKFGGTIEAYTYPDAFAACNGEGSPDGVTGLRVGQQSRAPFGFCYRSDIGDDTDTSVDPDKNYKLHLWWNCTASPSERQYSTINESPDAITMSWEISCIPNAISGMKPSAWMVIDTTKCTQTELEHLAVLEEVLYGRNAVTGDNPVAEIVPYLPTPDEVISIFKTGTVTAIPA